MLNKEMLNHDTSLLTHLENLGRETAGMKWVCRESSVGRGIRLHQLPAWEQGVWSDRGVPEFDTAREALNWAYTNLRGEGND